ncbi:MFS transporter [Actinomadura opuntiae]|uniref:MFS transporter n=1 Tax=Actinomadura sp. OS1-43 TaxID=604315 RepID=UPI00255AD494|nr:MFS transporter [Actinomadura sp. OS1-43]MDL4815043.1 MFS transporter [Actinomadura sp. OS1-43]
MVFGTRFGDLLALSGVRLPVLSVLGRLPAAICPIGTLMLVSENSGSVTAAGTVSGVLALGQAVGGPVVGRLSDRRGQRLVVSIASVLNAVAIVLLVAAALSDRPLAVQAACAGCAGAVTPQIGPLSRTRWLTLIRGHRDERRLVAAALSGDGTLDEISFTVGPAIAGVLAALVDPAAGMLLAAVLVAGCGVPFALHPAGRPVASGRAGGGLTRDRTPLLSGGLVILCAGMAAQGVFYGSVQIGLAALTEQLGHPEGAGLLYGLMGGVSAAAGLAVTVFPGRIDLTARLKLTALGLVAATVPLLAVHGMPGLTLAMALIGLPIAPYVVTLFGLAERTVPRSRMGEAMSVLVAGIIVPQAIGTVLAGRLAGAHGPSAAFAVTCAATVMAALLAAAAVTTRHFPPNA